MQEHNMRRSIFDSVSLKSAVVSYMECVSTARLRHVHVYESISTQKYI